jgi:hypothetical protein
MDIAARAGFRLPVHRPLGGGNNRPGLPPSSSQTPSTTQGVIPATALQHAGFYYFFAGNCAVKRRRRFLQSEKYEVSRCRDGMRKTWKGVIHDRVESTGRDAQGGSQSRRSRSFGSTDTRAQGQSCRPNYRSESHDELSPGHCGDGVIESWYLALYQGVRAVQALQVEPHDALPRCSDRPRPSRRRSTRHGFKVCLTLPPSSVRWDEGMRSDKILSLGSTSESQKRTGASGGPRSSTASCCARTSRQKSTNTRSRRSNCFVSCWLRDRVWIQRLGRGSWTIWWIL